MKRIFKKNWISISLLVTVLCLAYVVFMYADLMNTIDNSNILLRAIKNGKVLDFYELSVEEAKTNFSANYSIYIYVLFAIWQAPMLFLTRILQVDYLEFVPALLWSKTLIVLFSCFCGMYVYKIVLFITKNEEKALLAIFLFFSSVLCFFPVFICGQLDAISTCFMLKGTYCYIEGKYKKFLLWFLVAVPFKMFALILALPLILAREKNIFTIFIQFCSMISLLVIENIVYRNSLIYEVALGMQNRDVLNQIADSSVAIAGNVIVWIGLYGFILIFCFLRKEISNQNILYLSFFIWGTFAVFININPYWILLMIPFCIICVCVFDRYIGICAFLEMVGSVNYIFLIILSSVIFKDEQMVGRLLLKGEASSYGSNILKNYGSNVLKYITIKEMFERNGWDAYKNFYSTIYICVVLLLLILTCPQIQKMQRFRAVPIKKSILYLRIMTLMAIVCLIVYAYTAKSNEVAYDTRGQNMVASDIDILSWNETETPILEQEIVFGEDRALDELILRFKNPRYSRNNMSLVQVEMLDEMEDLVLFSTYLPCGDIKNASDIYVDLNGLHVYENISYKIRIRGVHGMEYHKERESLFLYVVDYDENSRLAKTEVNGVEQDWILYFMIR